MRISLNDEWVEVDRALISYDRLLELAQVTVGPSCRPSITYLFRRSDPVGGTLLPGDMLPLVEGMVIKVTLESS